MIYEEAPRTASEAYLEVEPLFAAGRIDILDHVELVRESKQLERRARSGGKTIVTHPHGGHDDVANAPCLAATVLTKPRQVWRVAGELLSERQDGPQWILDPATGRLRRVS